MLAAVLCCGISAPITFTANDGSFATVQGVYGGHDAGNLWYYGDDALDIKSAKEAISHLDMNVNSPVVIAVIDTGLSVSHELFDGVLLQNGEGQTMGYDSYSDSTGITEINDSTPSSHGNGIAGIMAMTIKELGLANYIKIYPIKASQGSKESVEIASVTRAINRAVDIGADVINMSFGLTADEMTKTNWTTDLSLKYAISRAAKSALLVAAAGNGGKEGSTTNQKDIFYPAAFDGVFSAVNYNSKFEIADDSNFGGMYDIAAPGTEILTAGSATGGSNYNSNFGGTSASAAFVSVAAALLKLRYKTATELDGYALARMMSNLADVRTARKSNYTYKCLNFRAVLTQDFENGTEYNYVPPTGLQLSHNGPMGKDEFADAVYFMSTDTATPVRFIATVTPYGRTDPQFDDMIKWYVKDSEGAETYLGNGSMLDYTATIFGETQIVARLTIGSNVIEATQRVHVRYKPYFVEDSKVTYESYGGERPDKVPTEGVLYTTEKTVFTMVSIKYLDQSVGVKWYVNGKYVGEGTTFAFRPTLPGVYKISAQYGDNPLYENFAFVATVKSFIAKPINLAVFFIAAAIIISVIIVTVVIGKRYKKHKDQGETGKTE